MQVLLWHKIQSLDPGRRITAPAMMPSPTFAFQILAAQGQARRGCFHTARGPIQTPVFAPVGTQGTVKTLDPRDLAAAGCDLLLANAYHLYLRPGHDLVARLGGLHEFMQWPGPLLTDSGGFQVFSLAHARQISDTGVTFKSHLDGSLHFYSPAKAMRVQEQLGADIAMVLDECAAPDQRHALEGALARTHRWAEECLEVHTAQGQALFGIVQGGIYRDLRHASAAFLAQLDFEGYAVGGLAVGEPKEAMYETLAFTCPVLPWTRPRYLMGVGAPEDIVEAVHRGVDMFDSVLPTRIARNGAVLHPEGRLNLRNAVHATAARPIQEDCACYTCTHFTRAYLHHLVRCREITGLRLCTLHNVEFMQSLMRGIRHAIAQGTWTEFREAFHSRYRISDQSARHVQRERWKAARAVSGEPRPGA